jgi:hypothetical protein
MDNDELLPKWFPPAKKEKTVGSLVSKAVSISFMVLFIFVFHICLEFIFQKSEGKK